MSGIGQKNERKRSWDEAWRKCSIEGNLCRICGAEGTEPHHIVPRSLGGDDEPENIVPLCRLDHDSTHLKRLDLGSHLTASEQAKAVLLLRSLERAHILLYPSEHGERRAA